MSPEVWVTVASVVIAAVLAGITYYYARTTQRMLKLQAEPYVLVIRPLDVLVVVNLSAAPIYVAEAKVNGFPTKLKAHLDEKPDVLMDQRAIMPGGRLIIEADMTVQQERVRDEGVKHVLVRYFYGPTGDICHTIDGLPTKI